jgi:hypothetical protein
MARAYVGVGLSVFPVKTDGSKTPAIVGWREYATRSPTRAELARWFDRPDPHGIGITGGPASGNLVVLDFEGKDPDPFARWSEKLTTEDHLFLARCPLVRTPSGGRHAYLRLPESAKGAKYARDADGGCLIEARGSQHFVVAPGSPPACHKTGRPYTVERAGWLDGRPAEPVPVEVFFRWTCYAAELNEYVRPQPDRVVGDRPVAVATGDRPGDHFNARVPWEAILARHGWRAFRQSGDVIFWTRPGKPAGVSATTGFCKGDTAGDLLFVFTSSAPPFEPDTAYSRFAAYTLLEHRGDFAAATRALVLAGYGRPLPARKGVRW